MKSPDIYNSNKIKILNRMNLRPRKSPELSYSQAPANMLLAEHLLVASRPRMYSDIACERIVSRAFGMDNFSLMPIDKPLGKHSYHAPYSF